MELHEITILPDPEPIAELRRLGDEIAELAAHLDAATARLLELIREFDAREGWSGFPSCAAWLSYRVGLGPRAAREKVRVARALATLPRISCALAHGEVSYAKVRAITRVATPDTEERLLAFARAGTAAHVERLVQGWRQVDRQAEIREGERQHRSRGVHVYQDDDGTFVIRGRLTPETGALVQRALEAARAALYPPGRETRTAVPRDHSALPPNHAAVPRNHPAADPPSLGQQQADALALLAETALHHELDPGAPGERYQVVVHVDAAALADADQPGQSALEDGPRVPAGTSQRLACDASRVVMRHDAQIVEVGARTRTIPPALRRALQHRDRGCRFPGCAVRVGQAHHIRHWAAGGPTTLSNTALLCRRHHRAVHEEGYQVARQPDGGLEFRTPQGWVLPDVPPAPPVANDPAGALRRANVVNGVRIDARTARPTWLGERVDIGYAIDVLHPLALRPSVMRE